MWLQIIFKIAISKTVVNSSNEMPILLSRFILQNYFQYNSYVLFLVLILISNSFLMRSTWIMGPGSIIVKSRLYTDRSSRFYVINYIVKVSGKNRDRSTANRNLTRYAWNIFRCDLLDDTT